MESSGTGISRLDCYEDMFKEITRKLYGEDPDHRTSSVQNEFETSVSFKTEEDTENADGSDDGNWTCDDEPLKGTDGSRIAAYHAGKATWRCYECGDCMAGEPREAAEHFMELHSSRILLEDSRNRHQSPKKEYLQGELKLEEIISYLERVRERAERISPPSRRTQETQTVPAALLPATSTFLLQELPSAPTPQQLQQNTTTMSTTVAVSASGKRYTCPYCPYGTDRRDLYTRHENIHREEKPFHCYICYKPFNRADHVKKHFLRMHREHGYELSRIRRPVGSSNNSTKPIQQDSTSTTGNAVTATTNNSQHTNFPSGYNNNKNYQLPTSNSTNSNVANTNIYQGTTTPIPTPGIMQADTINGTGRRVQNGGCNSKSHLKSGGKGGQERRYTCCYCSWSGVDNWCLKRHLNTHLKPFACALCEYKAARAERLATHVLKVHNRRQCSRCSFLAEDASQLQVHQLHVHRVSNANTSGSNNTTTPITPSTTNNNRHQQPIHPSGGGRPPPGPPVFPAPAPTIVPATTVIPPTTILGVEMVNSPAAAATMACISKLREDEKCYQHQPSDNGNEVLADRSNQQLHPQISLTSKKREEVSKITFTSSMNNRRSRKQIKPRKILTSEKFENDNEENVNEENVEENFVMKLTNESKQIQNNSQQKVLKMQLKKLKERYLRKRLECNRKGLLKCHQCPNDSSVNLWPPYHTRASLTLHNLWKHQSKNSHKGSQKDDFREDVYQSSSTHSAITLKATVYTNTNYTCHG